MIKFQLLFILFFSLIIQTASAADKFNVSVSIKPIHSIVAGLMKGVNTPHLLIKDQQSPFNLTLKQTDKDRLKKADVVIWVGAELEKTLKPTLDQLSSETTVIELLSNPRLKILPSRQNPDQRDPFFWLDDRNILILLDDLTELFTQIDPTHAHLYSQNRREMMKPLLRIDKEYEYGYRGLKAGLGVLYYDTLRYFEQAYALKTLGYVAGTPWDRVHANRLLNVRNSIFSKEAACLFTDKSMPSENLNLLTSEQNINIGELDILGQQFEAGADLYIKLMNYNTDVIKQCLNANMQEAEQARDQAYSYDGPIIDGIGGRFLLTNHRSEAVTDLDIKGHYSLIFFGYTHCPDICPTSLSVVSRALSILDKKPTKNTSTLTPYFVTVDPERDTVAIMQEYVRFFDSRLIGLTGSVAMVKHIADQFQVKFEKVPSSIEHPQQYAMNHTAGLFLMAPDGSFITKFAHEISAQTLANELSNIVH